MRRVGSGNRRPGDHEGLATQAGKRQKKSVEAKISPEEAERQLIADLQKAKKGPDLRAALHRWGSACSVEDNKNRHAEGLAVALKETADRINRDPNNGRAMRVTADQFGNWFSQINHDAPAMLVQDDAFKIDLARDMYQVGDTYIGFSAPRGALVEHVFKDSTQDESVAYPDPSIFAWLLQRFKRHPLAREALTLKRDEILRPELVTTAANAQATAFDAFLKDARGPIAAKIKDSVERLQSFTGEPNAAKDALDQLIKRLCKSFVDFTVAQKRTVHVSLIRIAWADATKVGCEGEQKRFTYAELRRLAKNPHATRTSFYDGITPVAMPAAFVQYRTSKTKA